MVLLCSCATTGSQAGISLQDAIEQSAEKIATELPNGNRVAIVAFETESNNLSNYIVEELTGALFDRGIEVADRQNLDYVYNELDLQMSGVVSDESAKSIGKFLGADMVITGQFTNIGNTYRYRTSAIHVEQASRASVSRVTVRNDQETRRIVNALANQTAPIQSSRYGTGDKSQPKTAGTFLDRGILFAKRGDFEMAIIDFTEAINLNKNMSSAYVLRGRALYANASRVVAIVENFDGVATTNYWGQPISEAQRLIYEKAIFDFTQAIRLDPYNAYTYKERSDVYSAIGDINKVIADYTQAIKLAPNDEFYYSMRGWAYRINGDFDLAISDYTKAIRLDPNSDLNYAGRGDAYFKKGDFNRAIADFSQAISLVPYSLNYDRRGEAYMQIGNYTRAIVDFENALKTAPNDIKIRQKLDEARRRQGK